MLQLNAPTLGRLPLSGRTCCPQNRVKIQHPAQIHRLRLWLQLDCLLFENVRTVQY